MIYLDSSVVLAKLLAEPRSATSSLWTQQLISSRLLEYEVWNRIHCGRLAKALGERTQQLINLIQLVELSPLALRRALETFPIPLRTLDALHLAAAEYVRNQGQEIALATFDARFLAAARALDVPLYDF